MAGYFLQQVGHDVFSTVTQLIYSALSHSISLSPFLYLCSPVQTVIKRVNLSVTDSITSSARLLSPHHLGAPLAQILLGDVTLSQFER